MGIIKAAINSIGGSFADQWLEYQSRKQGQSDRDVSRCQGTRTG
mgnify:CR=1 FL=1